MILYGELNAKKAKIKPKMVVKSTHILAFGEIVNKYP
jgi:hypothetical protein